MRYKGKTVIPSETVVVIPKGGVDIVIRAKAVKDYATFEKLCPEPTPRLSREPGQEPKPDYTDPLYKAAQDARIKKRLAYMILESLSASTDLEWETVNINDPATWENIFTELNNTFSQTEQNYIHKAIGEANGLNHEKIEEATESFLAGLAKQAET